MFNRFCFGALLIACLVVPFTGCNINSSGLDSIQVTPATNSIAVGSTVQLTATGTYGNAAHSSTGSVAGVTWASANTGVAIVGPCTGVAGCPTGDLASGKVLAVANGTTTITATAQGFNGQVSSTVSVTVTGGSTTGPTGPVSSEGLISLTIIPSSITVGNLQDTGNFIAIGTYTTAPVIRDVTNQAVWLSSFPNVFPVDSNTGGNAGATAGIVTAYGAGINATIIAEITDTGTKANPGTGSIQYATASFSCPYVAPCPCTLEEGCNPAITICPNGPVAGSCFPGSEAPSLLSTVTVYNEGLNNINWLVTANSATNTPNVISCGPGWAIQNGLTPAGAGSVCVATYPVGTMVTLIATQTGAKIGTGTFGGWSDNCTTISPSPSTADGPNTCSFVAGVPNPNYGLSPSDPNYNPSLPGTGVKYISSNLTVGAIFN
jgi:hypothetical protein